jgi:hypothetical protein
VHTVDTQSLERTAKTALFVVVCACVLLQLVVWTVQAGGHRHAHENAPPLVAGVCVADGVARTNCSLTAVHYGRIVLPTLTFSDLGLSLEHPRRWVAAWEVGLPTCMVCTTWIGKSKLGLPSGVMAQCYCSANVTENAAVVGDRTWTLASSNAEPHTFRIDEYEGVHHALCSLHSDTVAAKECIKRAGNGLSMTHKAPSRVYGREL